VHEIDCVIAGRQGQVGTLDEGSELVILREDKCRELKLDVNGARVLTMEAANGSKNDLEGCAEWVEIEISGVKTWAHAYIVGDAPYDLLLGRPWLRSVRLQKIEMESGVDVVIHSP
ncbi:hypothetical protein FA13DRAFT_1592169, partial [Coprinellus micaceus]